MNKRYKHVIYVVLSIMFLPFVAFLNPRGPSAHVASARSGSPTPTFDPLAQPPLPPDPTDYEFGRYLYWRHCMPCHGDRGQGLTDEFRRVWVEDHQDCWARGCHSGKYAEDSFYVPTIIPAVVKSDHLAQFPTQQDLFDYLKSTHPPQDPGFLEEAEYRALAFFVFTMNSRLPADSKPAPTFTPTPSLPPPSQANQRPGTAPVILVGFMIITIIVVLQMRAKARTTKI